MKTVRVLTAVCSMFFVACASCNVSLAGALNKQTNMEQKSKWEGFYVGFGSAGGTLMGYSDANALGLVSASDKFEQETGYLTGVLGYDVMVSEKFLVGGFVEYQAFEYEGPGLREWSIGGRVGYLATDNLLLFLSGGYSETKVNDMLFADFGHSEIDEWFDGKIKFPSYSSWFVGAGAEYMFAKGWSLRSEYRFMKLEEFSPDLPNIKTPFGVLPIDGDSLIHLRGGGDIHIFRATVNYKF